MQNSDAKNPLWRVLSIGHDIPFVIIFVITFCCSSECRERERERERAGEQSIICDCTRLLLHQSPLAAGRNTVTGKLRIGKYSAYHHIYYQHKSFAHPDDNIMPPVQCCNIQWDLCDQSWPTVFTWQRTGSHARKNISDITFLFRINTCLKEMKTNQKSWALGSNS